MRSIKQIMREIKKAYDEIVKNNEKFDDSEEDLLNFLSEEDSEIKINSLHDYIIENFNVEEIEILTKYLVGKYLKDYIEFVDECIDAANLNQDFKNMLSARLNNILDNSNELDFENCEEIINILDFALGNNEIIEEINEEDEEDKDDYLYSYTLDDSKLTAQYIHDILDVIINDTIYEEFKNNEDFYYELLNNYNIMYDINYSETIDIDTTIEKQDKNNIIETIDDCSNYIIDDMYYRLNYHYEYNEAINIIDSILNEETDVDDEYFKKYTDCIKSKGYIYNKHNLINNMKINIVKNYYKYKMGSKIINEAEENLIKQIGIYFDDPNVLIGIYDEDYSSSVVFIKACLVYYKYKNQIDKMLRIYHEEHKNQSITKINNIANKQIIELQHKLNNEFIISKDEFLNLGKYLDVGDIVVNIYDNKTKQKIPIGIKNNLSRLYGFNDISLGIIIPDNIKNIYILNYLLNTNTLSQSEKDIFITRMCEYYVNTFENINNNDYSYELLTIINKDSWVEVFKENKKLALSVFNLHIKKVESLKQKLNIQKNSKFFKDKNIIFMSDIYKDILNDLIYNLKYNDIYNDDEISKILFNYLCDITSINNEYYDYYFRNNNIDENLIKSILRFIIISEYYKRLKTKENANDIEQSYIKIIESRDKKYIDNYFSSNEKFYNSASMSYIENLNIPVNINEDDLDEKTLKKITPFYFKKKRD